MTPDGPAPGESQKEYDERIGPQAQAPPLSSEVQDLERQLADARAREAAQAPAGEDAVASALAAPVGSLAQGTPEEAQAAPAMEITHTEPLLAQGASGEPVLRLVRLLAQAGYATNTVVNATNPANVLDASVMADVQRFWADYPQAREPDELYAGREAAVHQLQGSWVGPHTWQVLYDLVKSKA